MVQNYCWGEKKKTHISLFPLIHTYSISISVCIRVGDPFKVWLYVGSGAPGGRWRCTEGPQIGTLHCTALHIVTLLLNVGAVAAEQYYMTLYAALIVFELTPKNEEHTYTHTHVHMYTDLQYSKYKTQDISSIPSITVLQYYRIARKSRAP